MGGVIARVLRASYSWLDKVEPKKNVMFSVPQHYYETTAPIRNRRVDRYAGTFFICWGDETLNMIVNLFIFRSALQMDQVSTALY
uniref:Uncharacterized protein n=1 Tax=Candidatus Kentrum sp. LPFa TaxID=2126335 RepID=A0A450W8B5_9GAMM|nr:MAG: hypothetical protein BECKLPF1236B_GA0070989_10455 [Candidatus Kentron sp. LPFa]